MVARKTIKQFKVIALTGLLLLSIFSFVYINSVDLDALVDPQEKILVEELEEQKKEALPDVQLIKLIMHKAIEFVTLTLPNRM